MATILGLGLLVYILLGSRYRVEDLVFRVRSLGFRVQCLGFRVQR